MEKKVIISTISIIFFIMVTETVFGQISDLVLDPSDIRFELVYLNDAVIGYNLFVRKRPGIESVMLTEPSGNYALRSVDWNPTNGSERRELSGVPLSEAHSRYSILSSTPIYDMFFGSAFLLYIPLRVVYGNPSSSAGTVLLQISNGVQINIRTFDHQFADPNTGRFQNNLTLINNVIIDDNYYLGVNLAEPPLENRSRDDDIEDLKTALRRIGIDNRYLNIFRNNTDLEIFLHEVFIRRYNERN